MLGVVGIVVGVGLWLQGLVDCMGSWVVVVVDVGDVVVVTKVGWSWWSLLVTWLWLPTLGLLWLMIWWVVTSIGVVVVVGMGDVSVVSKVGVTAVGKKNPPHHCP